jgi:hypothetical protein
MSTKIRNTVLATAVLATTLMSVGSAFAGSDPTQGRIDRRQASNNRAEYHQCAAFSIRVLRACTDQAGIDTNAVRGCRSHYQNNLTRCQAL